MELTLEEAQLHSYHNTTHTASQKLITSKLAQHVKKQCSVCEHSR